MLRNRMHGKQQATYEDVRLEWQHLQHNVTV